MNRYTQTKRPRNSRKGVALGRQIKRLESLLEEIAERPNLSWSTRMALSHLEALRAEQALATADSEAEATEWAVDAARDRRLSC